MLPEEDAGEFADLEAALIEELAPVGALQTVLAGRVAGAAWRLARADHIEAELFEERRGPTGGLGLALIRDGNGARSFETLLRYRGAAMAEFWRALKTLKALQAEQAAQAEQAIETSLAVTAHPVEPAARPQLAPRLQPNEPERGALPRSEYLPSLPPVFGALHEPTAPLATERTRADARRPAPAAVESAGAQTIRRTRACRNEVGQADPGPRATPEISAAAGRTARAS